MMIFSGNIQASLRLWSIFIDLCEKKKISSLIAVEIQRDEFGILIKKIARLIKIIKNRGHFP